MPAKKAKKKKRERSWGEHKTAPKVAALMTNFSNRDRLTNEERLSDLVEILAHGLLWLDAFSVDLCAPCGRDRRLVRGASAIRRDRLTTEERLSDIVEILAHGLLWLDAFSVDLCSHVGSCAALAHVASWHIASH